MKKAVFTGPSQPLKVVDDVIPEVPPEGALIKTTYSGVCHSDVHLRKNAMDLGDGVIVSFGEKYIGTVFGHEIGGTILAFGEKANTGDLKIGDNVIIYPWIGCEECGLCKAGHNNLCENLPHKDIGCGPKGVAGGYATHTPVSQCSYLIKVPDNLPMSVACMLPCSGATTYASLVKVLPQIDQAINLRGHANLLIVGAGGLGLWCVQLARKAVFADKNVKIFVADISEDKFGLALEAGADGGFVWDREGTMDDTVKTTTKNGEEKMDVVINLVGNQKTSEIAVNCLHNGGILVITGLAGGSMKISLPLFLLSGKIITGGKSSSLHELKDLVGLVSKLGITFPNLKFVALDEVDDTLNDLEAGKIKGRAILKFDS